MNDRPTPYDEDAELAIVAAMWIASSSQRSLALDALTPGDFHLDSNAQAFTAIGNMHRRGDTMDAYVLTDELRRTLGDASIDVARKVVTGQGMPWSMPGYVDIITRLSVSRAVQAAAQEVALAAKTGTVPAIELVELARERMAGIDVPVDAATALTGLSTIDEFVDTADITPAPWIVPGLMRAGWRALIVAPEGVGKSVAFRSIAIASAAGVHPFSHTPMTPVRTLLIDLENPDDAIAETAGPMARTARQVKGHNPDRAWLWRRPEGIDIRARADRAAFHQVLEQVRPDLVCLGPLYKAYRPQHRESDEAAAADVQAILDDARTRYSFSLLMEHHAPKASGMAARDLVPYGSSLWMRWPELGVKLIPVEDGPPGSLLLGRFRLDRMANDWPDRLDRCTGDWPWVGYWRKGMNR